MKRAVGVIVLLGLLGAFGWYLYGRLQEASDKPQGRRGRGGPVAVEVAPVETGRIRDIGQFTGTLKAKSQFVVAPKIAGRLETLAVNIGDRVDSGDLIAILDADEYRLAVEEARAALKVSQANLLETKSALETARREFERVKTLYDRKIASESELDAARSQFEAKDANYRVTQAQVAQKEAQLKTAEVRLSYTSISVVWHDRPDTNPGRPRTGLRRVIGERYVDPGAMLRANDPIVSVLDPNTVVAVVYIIERDYAEVEVGQEAIITTDAYPTRRFTGRVVRVAPLLKEASRQARVEIAVPNPDWALRPGMFIKAALEFAAREHATLVPATAISRRDGRSAIFLADLENNKAVLVEVTTGITEGDRVEILAPPIAGDVVTLGQHLLSDGAEIKVAAPTTRPTTTRRARRDGSDGVPRPVSPGRGTEGANVRPAGQVRPSHTAEGGPRGGRP